MLPQLSRLGAIQTLKRLSLKIQLSQPITIAVNILPSTRLNCTIISRLFIFSVSLLTQHLSRQINLLGQFTFRQMRYHVPTPRRKDPAINNTIIKLHKCIDRVMTLKSTESVLILAIFSAALRKAGNEHCYAKCKRSISS